MIVCKIVADFDGNSGDFSGFFDSLARLGAVRSSDDVLYFASSLEPVDKKKVKRMLKKFGYSDSVIVEYGVNNPPKENPAINGWLFDFITQNALMRLGREHREAMLEGIKQLDDIDALIKKELDSLPEEPATNAGIEQENVTDE